MATKEEEMDDVEEELDEEESSLTNPDVVTKYKTAAEIANFALAEIIKQAVPEKKIADVCVFGDKLMNDKIAEVYKTGKVEKGIAFPTTISVNNCAGHFSPLPGDAAALVEGDVVKVDLGVQIDGFISVCAHTFICQHPNPASPPAPISGRKADVICAAHYAAECAHRLIKPGKKNTDVTEIIKKVAEQFKVNPLEGVLSHQMKRYVIDGNKSIINKETLEHKVDEFEFQENEVYAVDIVMSTGDGKAKELETRTTIYKRAVDQNYLLKMQASRYVLNEINKNFPTFPFSVRALEEKRGKLGITELLKHDLLHPYPVLYEKNGEFVAQFKFTVLVLPTQTQRLNQFTLPFVQSEHKIQDKVIDEVLAMGTKRAKKNKKKKKTKTEGEKKEGEKKSGEKMDTTS